MPYGMRSPMLRNYLDRKNAYGVGNRYGAGLGSTPVPGMPQPPSGGTRNFTPNYQLSGMSPMPQMGGGLPGFAQGAQGMFNRPQTGQPGTMTPLDPSAAQQYVDYDRALYAGPDYKGRHEANETLKGAYLRMLQRQAAEGPIDFSGSSQVADQFANQREMLQNQLAARGIAGSGVEAGALANSYGSQAKAMGQFYRDALEQRRREHLAEQMRLEDWTRQIQGAGLQRNWAEQDDPGFFGDVMGTLGGVVGSLIPGIGPAIGGAISGIGGNNRQQAPQYGFGTPGQQSIYGPPAYPYVDEINDPWSPFYQGGGY